MLGVGIALLVLSVIAFLATSVQFGGFDESGDFHAAHGDPEGRPLGWRSPVLLFAWVGGAVGIVLIVIGLI